MGSKKRILIACGGTGGHLAPGIALAQTLVERGHSCELLISQKQVDKRLSEKYTGLTFHAMPAVAPGKTHQSLSPAGLLNFSLGQIASLKIARHCPLCREPLNLEGSIAARMFH